MQSDLAETAEYQRRYSAIAVCDDRISGLSDLRQRVSDRLGVAERLPGSAGVTLYRVEFMDSVFRYSSVEDPSGGAGLRPHLGYVAFFGGSHARTTLLVSPFARLLGRVVRDLDARSDPPLRGYYRFDIGRLIARIRESGLFEVEKVAAVTLRVTGDVTVDLVRLTGSAPLVSTLLANVEGMRVPSGNGPEGVELAVPYGLVMRVGQGLDVPVRLSIDRHGNVHWYQLGEPAVGAVVDVLRRLDREGDLVSVDRRVPLEQNRLSPPT